MSDHVKTGQHHIVLVPLSAKNVDEVIRQCPHAAPVIAANTFRAVHQLAILDSGHPIGYTAHSSVIATDGVFRIPAIYVAPGHDGCDLIVVDLLIETAIAIGNISEFVIEAHDGQHVEKYIEWCAGWYK